MKNWMLTVAIAATTFTGAFAQIDRSQRPAAAKAPVINIKDPEVFTLKNGITVVLSENHKLPKISFDLVMGGTPMTEGNKAGVNDMMGQLILSGTTKRSKDQLDNETDYIGATLNADGNSIYMSCLTKHLDKGLSLMQDVTMNPSFPESEFERVKKQNESALLSAKANPEAMASNAERKVNFPNHPYGDVMSETTLANITRQDVLNNFKMTFTPKKAYLVIVGDITRPLAQQLAEQYFGGWTGVEPHTADPGFGTPVKGNRVIFVNKPGAVQSTISVSFPVAMKPGDQNQLPLTVLNGVLGGGGFGTRLMQNLREKKAYTYGAYSSLDVDRNGSYLSASGNFRNDVTDSAIIQLLYEFNNISEGYVTNDELSLTKSTMAGGFARSLESPQTIARFALSIIQNNLPADYYKTYLQRLEAVNREDLLTMAQRYFKDGYNIIVVGNESVLDKIRVFDADGVIEKLDAFGDPVKEMRPADISADELIVKYAYAVTMTNNQKALTKKISKIKSVERKADATIEGAPMALTRTEIFVAPNKEYEKIEASGMTVMSTSFNGKTGYTTNMQEGRKDLTADEIAAKQRTSGLIPELSYKNSNVTYEIKGIESLNGKDYYVLHTLNGDTETFDYYSKDSFLKERSVIISKEDGETQEVTLTMTDYKEVSGMLFPHSQVLMVGPMVMTGTTKSITVNGKVDQKVFE
jgi:zinc protease